MASVAGGRAPIILFAIIVLIVIVVILYLAYIYEQPGVLSSRPTRCTGVTPPTGLRAVSFQLRSIKLSWFTASNAVRYKIFVGAIPDVKESTSIQDYLVPSTQTEFTVNDVILGRTYYFKIKSINACGNTSVFSAEVSATVGYPPVFRIISRDQPNKCLRVANNFTDIDVGPICSGDPGDTLCLWKYDSAKGRISSVDTPAVCMTAKPYSITNEIKHEPCANLEFFFSGPFGTWNYTPSEGSLCHRINNDGINCIKIGPDNVTAIKAPYNGASNMQWDIVEYQS